MAKSTSHRLGQLIGDLLEEVLEPHLREFTKKHNLFLDKKGQRLARKNKKLTWQDANGNKHDLDFVIEKNGDDGVMGSPLGFIETAWRSYTKHSKNKAQEIQGAIIPLAETFKNLAPFKGVVLAGEFTGNSITQLESLGFKVLYFPGSVIFQAYQNAGYDIKFNESSSEKELKAKLKICEGIKDTSEIKKQILSLNGHLIKDFMKSLEIAITRTIKRIIICPIYGKDFIVDTLDKAVTFLKKLDENTVPELAFREIYIRIVYNNGTTIDGNFTDKAQALKHLEFYKTL